MSQETHLALRKVDALCGFEQLNDRAASFNFKDLASSDLSVGEFDLAQFIEGNAFYVINDHQGVRDLLYGLIFSDHSSSPPAAASSIWAYIRSMISS